MSRCFLLSAFDFFFFFLKNMFVCFFDFFFTFLFLIFCVRNMLMPYFHTHTHTYKIITININISEYLPKHIM